MELKNFSATDLAGNVIPNPTAYLYMPGTTTLATGLVDQNGSSISNPLTGASNGSVSFAAPDGDYDLRIIGAGRDYTMRVRFSDARVFKQFGTGAVERTMQDKGREILSAADFGLSSTVTIHVPADYPSLESALMSLSGKRIAAGTYVNIRIADGVYVIANQPNLKHPDGERISITGNPSNPDNCVLKVSGLPVFDLLYLGGGYKFGTIEGVSLSLDSKATQSSNFGAIVAEDGSCFLEAKNFKINNWYYSVAARSGSEIFAHDGIANNAGDVSIWAFSGGKVRGYNLTVQNASDAENSLGYGYQAEYGGVVDVSSSSASGCLKGGFAALSNGTGRFYACTASANAGSGFITQGGGIIEANGSATLNNSRYGIEFVGDGTCTGIGTNSGNTLGQNNGHVYLDNGSLGARIASNGSLRIDANGPDNIVFNTQGGIQAVIGHASGAINYPKLSGSSSGVSFEPDGASPVIDVSLKGKGSNAYVFIGNNGANYFRINPAAAGGVPSLRVEGTDADKDFYMATKGAGAFRFATFNGSSFVDRVVISGSGEIKPGSDNAYSLGNASARFSSVWAANGTIQTSDQRTKENILPSALGLDFIKALRPVSYTWKVGSNEVIRQVYRDADGNECDPNAEGATPAEIITHERPGTRTHWGLIAQEVKAATDAVGVDFGGWVLSDKDDPGSQQALRYDQFIAPLIKAIQELDAKLSALTSNLKN